MRILISSFNLDVARKLKLQFIGRHDVVITQTLAETLEQCPQHDALILFFNKDTSPDDILTKWLSAGKSRPAIFIAEIADGTREDSVRRRDLLRGYHRIASLLNSFSMSVAEFDYDLVRSVVDGQLSWFALKLENERLQKELEDERRRNNLELQARHNLIGYFSKGAGFGLVLLVALGTLSYFGVNIQQLVDAVLKISTVFAKG
jgi:hypothetical protein